MVPSSRISVEKRDVMSDALVGLGCLGKAAPSEPVFVLRANDKLARFVVGVWIGLARLAGCPRHKLDRARAVRDAMQHWNARYGSRRPD